MALIPFHPPRNEKQPPIEVVTNAAWQLAYAALWQEQYFNNRETTRVKREIAGYLQSGDDIENGFLTFCERIILANRHYATGQSRYLPHPSIWFNQHYQQGYCETSSWHNSLQQNPEPYKGVSLLAKHYWQYLLYPCAPSFINCRKQLRQLREYGLIQLFYNAVIYSQIINPVK
jgi:hypothetical protein